MINQFIPIVSWSEVKKAIDEGRKAYYVDCVDFWDIMVVDEPVITCEILKTASFGVFGPEVDRYFSQQSATDFETNYMPKLLKSNMEFHPAP